ncbi:phospholipid carrier-dependent glycosyltransferase [Olleya sp. YSTF-M6]|uniref:Phospholipid carrier-dependent glycosyltransferase n=1 Tax=Olleya sediminilitoris TaxID=2795739 RepID=A0ABS1WPK9_9FLAO|nr:phospholipid carrier-dependent glycosyltransferase [Olleya sediminilitoris]MBL7561059.1 phospholipid carrier-dependent glycosyltransferase [Olleya sediminilitoris]
MPKFLKKYPLATLCLLIAIMLLPNLDTIQVTIMEARNFITAREMIQDNNWLLTTMNGQARYEKPPLPTWLTAISGLVFGVKSIFGMRLPAIIMIMVLAIYSYKLSNLILKNQIHSYLNTLILVTSFYVIGITIEAPWDIFTHGFMMVAIYHLVCFFNSDITKWTSVIYAGFFIGCSILSKGPVSFYALLLPFTMAYGFSFKYNTIKPKIVPILALLIIALTIGGWWYLYVRLEDVETFKAITSKETGNWTSYNVRPFYYYWSFFTQSGLWTIPAFISLLYPYLKSRVINFKAYKFTLLWTIFAVILLSLIPEKKSRYLMPVLIPLALNIGFYINYLIREFKSLTDKRETIPVYFNFGLIAVIGMIAPIALFFMFKTELSQHPIKFAVFVIVAFTLGLFILLKLIKKDIKTVFILTTTFFGALFLFGLPLFKTFTSSNFKPINSLLKTHQEAQVKLYNINHISPEAIWQYGTKIPQITKKEGAYTFPEATEFGVLANNISEKDQEIISKNYSFELIKTFDLNESEPDSKQYKDRLISKYYYFRKK